MSLTLQGNQYLPTGHVLQPAVGLEPLPSLTKYLGNVGAAAVPMFIDSGLDQWQIGVGNGPFSERPLHNSLPVIARRMCAVAISSIINAL